MVEPTIDATEHGRGTPFPIFVDKQRVEVQVDSLTGAQIRNLITPPIGEDRALYLIGHGGEDKPIEDDESVPLKPGTRFMSVPRHINPGQL